MHQHVLSLFRSGSFSWGALIRPPNNPATGAVPPSVVMTRYNPSGLSAAPVVIIVNGSDTVRKSLDLAKILCTNVLPDATFPVYPGSGLGMLWLVAPWRNEPHETGVNGCGRRLSW